MTERLNDKSNDCGRAISDLENFSWNELLNALQYRHSFGSQGGHNFLGIMGKRKPTCKDLVDVILHSI